MALSCSMSTSRVHLLDDTGAVDDARRAARERVDEGAVHANLRCFLGERGASTSKRSRIGLAGMSWPIRTTRLRITVRPSFETLARVEAMLHGMRNQGPIGIIGKCESEQAESILLVTIRRKVSTAYGAFRLR